MQQGSPPIRDMPGCDPGHYMAGTIKTGKLNAGVDEIGGGETGRLDCRGFAIIAATGSSFSRHRCDAGFRPRAVSTSDGR